MLPTLLLLALCAAILWALWSATRGRAAFVLKIARGEPRVVRGTVTAAFIQEAREVCGRHGVEDGFVQGVVRDGRIALEFSDSMPAQCRQQLRNVWVLSGWSAGARRAASR
jgi:Protein of unknown function (DUF3634)